MRHPPAITTAIVLLIALSARAEDWPHWRGPSRNDYVAESSGWERKAWPPNNILWQKNVGLGASSPLVVRGRLYTMGWRDNRDYVICLNAASGAMVWTQTYACPRYGRKSDGDKGLYSGVSSTPEMDTATGLLYTLSTDGHLNCWDTRSQGKHIWGISLYDQYTIPMRARVNRSARRDYGFTSSPLVHGDWLIVEVGAKEGTMMAFDKMTGTRRWVSEANSSAGHNAGPVPITVERIPCVATHSFDGLLVIRLDKGSEGKTVATYPWATSFANNIATASVYQDFVLLTSAYNQYKIVKLRITLSGATKIWEQERASGVCTPIVHEGHVYWAWKNLICLDFETGKVLWEGGRYGAQGSCILTSDNRLIAWSNNGDLTLVETAGRSPNRYTELSSRRELGKSDAWPHVVLSDGRLYCRDRLGNLLCLDLSGTSTPK